MSGGIVLIIELRLLPIGLAQTWVNIKHRFRFACRAESLHLPFVEAVSLHQVTGDTYFYAGKPFAYFVIGLVSRMILQKNETETAIEVGQLLSIADDIGSLTKVSPS